MNISEKNQGLLKEKVKQVCVKFKDFSMTSKNKIVYIFLAITFSICFGCPKEPSLWDGSFEYPQHMFWLRNKKINFLVRTLNKRPVHTVCVKFKDSFKCLLTHAYGFQGFESYSDAYYTYFTAEPNQFQKH